LVNKLLTQNLDEQSKQFKDSLDLNMLETQLKRTPEVKNIEVYKLPQGGVSVEVTERKPLFEVAAERRFFGDAEGVLFEYQVIDSLKLPVFEMDSTFTSVIPTAKLITKLRNDPLLDMELETIYLRDNEYTLGLRSFPFEVILGDSTQLKQKIEKLKVFCAFQNSQDSLNGYDKINLSYKNQVVAITL
jgi:cell division protein FtsQ